jgi:3-hydroxybutyrate dehydrogenase
MKMDQRALAGRCAVVTGSSAGLGAAIAERLAADGCDVVLNGIATGTEMAPTQRALEAAYGVRTLFHGADVGDPAQIAAMMAAAEEAFGRVDVLVNNAVVRQFAAIERMAVQGWDRSLAVNLSAAFHTIRLALPGMRERGFGRIVNVSSIYGLVGGANRADYVTTKTGLIGLTRAVALETAEADITCNAICPGTVATEPIEQKIRDLAAAEGVSVEAATGAYLAERQPSRRFVAKDAVAAMVAFLCGPGGRDVTGAAIPIDGGWSAA